MDHNLIRSAMMIGAASILTLGSCRNNNNSQTRGVNSEPSPVGTEQGEPMPSALSEHFRQDRTIEWLRANCNQVTTPLPGDDEWYIRGYDPGFVIDRATGEILAFYWSNANPSQPPDISGEQCWGTFCHWVPASEVNDWTVAHTCDYGTPGYDTIAFFAR